VSEWCVLEAELLEAELFVHTHSPEANAEYAALLGSELASARAAYAAAREAGDHEAAVRAAIEWADTAQVAGVVSDGMKAQQRNYRDYPSGRCTAYAVEWPE
jgi:hypothetical protein